VAAAEARVNDDAFRALFDAHAEYVMKSLRRLGVRPGDVEDVAHEVFLAVLRRWDAFDPARPARPWLFGFALRFASAYRGSAYVRRERLEEGEAGQTRTSEQLFLEREESKLVYLALDALDHDKRVVFTMFELDERPAVEIAAELGIPQNTVFSRLRAAREEFASAVKRLSLRSPRLSVSAPAPASPSSPPSPSSSLPASPPLTMDRRP
jgi:RNA polymerase sigma-70 factor (ECF subfamily)